MRQLLAQTQHCPQLRADRQQFQHPTVSGLQIRPQDQAGHQLPLGEIMAGWPFENRCNRIIVKQQACISTEWIYFPLFIGLNHESSTFCGLSPDILFF